MEFISQSGFLKKEASLQMHFKSTKYQLAISCQPIREILVGFIFIFPCQRIIR